MSTFSMAMATAAAVLLEVDLVKIELANFLPQRLMNRVDELPSNGGGPC